MRDYEREWEMQKRRGKLELARRAARARARRMFDRLGIERRGKDIDHKIPLSKTALQLVKRRRGGANGKHNLRLVSPSANRSFSRNSDRSVKRND